MFFLDRVANLWVHGAHAVRILTVRMQNYVCDFVTNVPVATRSAVVRMHENTHAQKMGMRYSHACVHLIECKRRKLNV